LYHSNFNADDGVVDVEGAVKHAIIEDLKRRYP